MISTLLLVSLVVSFFVSITFMPLWIRKARAMGLMWEDVHKHSNEKIAGSGGIVAALAFIIGVFFFVAFRTFALGTTDFLIEILALISVSLFLLGIGFIDDLFGWQHGGMRKKDRIILVALAAIPLMAINAGRSDIVLPFLGTTDLGIFYPLFLIPLGIVGAATTYNFVEGMNGLGTGQGIIFLSAMALVSFATGNSWLAVIALCMVAALFGFLIYNFVPAKVLPGDSLTYLVGGLIATISILGNFEKIAVFFFIPYIIETGLKIRGKLQKHSFGKLEKDGTLSLRYPKHYSLTHVAISLLKKLHIPSTERNVVISIWIFQTLLVGVGFWLFREGIFA